MERKILFRGKRIDNGKWVEGFYFLMSDDCVSVSCIGVEPLSANDYSEIYRSCYEVVAPETISQCTNITDKNGKLIWEGDIIVGKRYKDYGQSGEYVPNKEIIKWSEEKARFSPIGYWDSYYNDVKNYEVVGNIFDNPELLG